VPQGEVDSDVSASWIGGMFGVVGTLLDSSINQDRATDAENRLKTVRNALYGYNFDQRALDTAKTSLGAMKWLGIGKTSFFKDASPDRLNHSLDAATTQQAVFAVFHYAFTDNFNALSTRWTISIVPKTTARDGDRFDNAHVIYRQSFVCVSPLAMPANDAFNNTRQWSAGQARLARMAIEACFTRFEPLVRRSMEMTPAQREALKNGANFTDQRNGISGKLIEQTKVGNLVLDDSNRWVLILDAKAIK
jgi:hypothetical protein